MHQLEVFWRDRAGSIDKYIGKGKGVELLPCWIVILMRRVRYKTKYKGIEIGSVSEEPRNHIDRRVRHNFVNIDEQD